MNRRLVVALGALLLVACNAPETPPKSRPVPAVEVAPVQQVERTRSVSGIGTLRANETLMVRPEIAARVVSLGFQEGGKVRRGQLLVQLDDAQARADAASVRAALTLARAELRRAEGLPADLIARLDLDRLKAQVAIQEAALARADALLAKTRLVAPFDGVAGLRQFSPGEVVSAGQSLFSLTAVNPVKLDLPVPETRAGEVRVGQQVSAQVPALADAVVSGRVAAIEPVLDGAARALRVRILIDNAGGRLQPGMTARVTLATAAPEQVIVVPDQAVVPMAGRQTVFVLRDGNMAVAVPVEPGRRADGLTEIRTGLTRDDRIVVSGQNKLNAASQPVRPVPLAADAVTPASAAKAGNAP